MSIEEVEWGGENAGAGALCNVYGRGAFFLRSLGVRGSVMSMSAASRRLDVKSRLDCAFPVRWSQRLATRVCALRIVLTMLNVPIRISGAGQEDRVEVAQGYADAGNKNAGAGHGAGVEWTVMGSLTEEEDKGMMRGAKTHLC